MKNQALVGIFFCLIFACMGQIFLKIGIESLNIPKEEQWRLLKILFILIKNTNILMGFTFAGLSAISWLFVLKRVPLNFAYPFMALTFILIPLLSKFVLNESVPVSRWVGGIIIIIGVALSSI